jgi:SAM-dependent methyltransferase
MSQYDALAELSEQTANSPLRKFYEEHTLFHTLGDVENLSVLDLACGTGLYTRKLKARGAKRVLGVDNSVGMIDYAQHLERTEPVGVDYRVGDVTALGDIGVFDTVLAAYLLHYAPTKESLFAMCRNVRASLAPGGRFVTIAVNPDINLTDPAYYLPYGFQVSGGEVDGAALTLEIVLPGMEMKLNAHRWTRESYESALREAGFVDIEWLQPKCDALGIEIFGEEFWTAYLAQPHAVVFTARAG